MARTSPFRHRTNIVSEKHFLPSLEENPKPIVQIHTKVGGSTLTKQERKEAIRIIKTFQHEEDLASAVPPSFRFKPAMTVVIDEETKKKRWVHVCRIRGTHLNSRHKFNPTPEYAARQEDKAYGRALWTQKLQAATPEERKAMKAAARAIRLEGAA